MRRVVSTEQANTVQSKDGQEAYLELIARYPELFKEELGLLKGTLATIALKPEATPKFYKPRPVPYAYKAKVEAELKRLQEEGTIEPLTFSECAAPIVPVMKQNGTVMICDDYRLTVNQAAQRDSYSLQRIDDILASLAGGQTFTKLDLSQAYQQVAPEVQSKDYVVINTHLGLFKYNRLPFGVCAAPSIF